MSWRRVALAGVLALATRGAGAQEASRLDVTGSLRGGYWSSTRDLDDREPLGAGMIWLKGTVPLPRRATLFAEGWGALRGPPDHGDGVMELREAYVAASFGALDLRLGRQILAWGRADGVNPTGNLAAEDLTLLTPDDADRRLGATSAVASYYVGGISVSALWLPEFRGHRFPLPPAAGLSFVRESPQWPGDQWAVRVERTGGSVDWSASLFQGLDLLPDLQPSAMPGQIALRHHRIRVVGADAATTVGRFGLRAEGAYVHTEDGAGKDPFTKNPFVFLVVGGDRTYDGRLNVNVQYLLRVVTHFRETTDDVAPDARAIAAQQAVLSSQTRRVQHGASMRASVKWLHETLETEWAAIAYAAPRGIAMRPKVSFAVTDRVTVVGGAELYRGSDASIFRLLRPNSVAFLEMRWGF